MIISRFKVAVSFILALLLQPAIGALLGLENFGPNLLLCLASIMIILIDDSPFVWGFTLITCIIYDACFSPVMGMATISIVVALLWVLAVKYFFYLDNILLVPILAVIDTISYNLVGWLISNGIGGAYTFGYILKCTALDFIGNTIVIFLLYLIFRKHIEKHANDLKAI